MISFSYEGRTLIYDSEAIDLDQGIAIQDYTGLALGEWETALTDPAARGYLKALKALVWVVLVQNGELIPGPALANAKIAPFLNSLVPALAAEAAGAAPAEEPAAEPVDPTTPAAAPSPGSATRPDTTPPGTDPAPPTPAGG